MMHHTQQQLVQQQQQQHMHQMAVHHQHQQQQLHQQQVYQQQQQQQLHHAQMALSGSPGGVPLMLGPAGGQQHPGFLGGIFHKRERKLSKSDDCSGLIVSATNSSNSAASGAPGTGPFGRSTEV